MARIRQIKPDFFRHEILNELETSHGDLRPMLVFSGLWCQCDKQGVFVYKPRQLKLDILPFVDFDMAKTLKLLEESGLISVFEDDGKKYGHILTFRKHQRISGEEAKQGPRNPAPKHEGSKSEASQKQEGSTKEASQKQDSASSMLPTCPGVGSREYGVGSRENGIGNSRTREEIWDFPIDAQKSPNDGTTRFEAAKRVWNSEGLTPPQRKSLLQVSPEERSAVLATLSSYSDAEVAKAIETYAKIRASPDHEIKTPYRSLVGFIRSGVEKFVPEADPWTAYAEAKPFDDEPFALSPELKAIRDAELEAEHAREVSS